jgi:hypothetical protein
MTLRSIAILCALGCFVLNFPALASLGTGFAIANGSLIITNFHVIRGCTTITIPNVGSGVIKAADPNLAVAVIEPERPVKASLRFRSRDFQLKLGEEIIVIGFHSRACCHQLQQLRLESCPRSPSFETTPRDCRLPHLSNLGTPVGRFSTEQEM